jgi:hypothetical protein
MLLALALAEVPGDAPADRGVTGPVRGSTAAVWSFPCTPTACACSLERNFEASHRKM